MLGRVRVLGRRAESGTPAHGPSSIFAKALRDSRRAILLAGIGLGLGILAVGQSTAANYATIAGRQQQILAYSNAPAMGSLFGIPIGIETLGGLVSWRDASLIVLILGMWSIVALSGALAGEVSAGSADILVAMPISRRRIAAEKVAAHIVALGLIAVILAGAAWLTGIVFARLPGDSIAFTDALADFLGLGLLALIGGSIALALSAWLGKGAGSGLAIALFLGSFFVFAYQDLVPVFGAIKWLSPFDWTAHNQPIAGSWDLVSLVPVAGLVAALLASGMLAFERRDLGQFASLPRLRLPARSFLLRGPARRVFLDTRATALAWGLGLGLAMALIGAGSRAISKAATADPASERVVRQLFGDTDWTSAKGMLQLTFVWFGYLIMALAATTFLRSLAADERQRRLEMVLATPVSRARWLISGGLGVLGSVALMTLTIATLIGLGVWAGGQDPVGPFLGVWAGGLYAAALVGIALAVLGLGGVEIAPAVPVVLGIGFFFLDTMANLLRLPSAITSLCLTHYLGRPMVGTWDWPGMALLAGIAVAGIAVGAWAMNRRDVTK